MGVTCLTAWIVAMAEQSKGGSRTADGIDHSTNIDRAGKCMRSCANSSWFCGEFVFSIWPDTPWRAFWQKQEGQPPAKYIGFLVSLFETAIMLASTAHAVYKRWAMSTSIITWMCLAGALRCVTAGFAGFLQPPWTWKVAEGSFTVSNGLLAVSALQAYQIVKAPVQREEHAIMARAGNSFVMALAAVDACIVEWFPMDMLEKHSLLMFCWYSFFSLLFAFATYRLPGSSSLVQRTTTILLCMHTVWAITIIVWIVLSMFAPEMLNVYSVFNSLGNRVGECCVMYFLTRLSSSLHFD